MTRKEVLTELPEGAVGYDQLHQALLQIAQARGKDIPTALTLASGTANLICRGLAEKQVGRYRPNPLTKKSERFFSPEAVEMLGSFQSLEEMKQAGFRQVGPALFEVIYQAFKALSQEPETD